jgi:preprotein translocase subunit SecA
LFKTRFVSLSNNLNTLDPFELKTYLFQEFWLSYEAKVLEFEICQTGLIRSFERTIILYYTDIAWKEHLQKIALLRDAVGWRSYGQRNPLFEFKEEAYNLFQNRNITIRHLLIRDFLHSFIL